MELFLVIVGLFIAFCYFSSMSGGTGVSKTVNRFQTKHEFVDKDDDIPFDCIEISMKGRLPVRKSAELQFITYVFDETDDKSGIVLSAIETFQSDTSRVFEFKMNTGVNVHPGWGFTDWVTSARIIPEILVTPYGGERELVAVTYLVDVNNPPTIICGLPLNKEHPGILHSFEEKFVYNNPEKGYIEARENREKANDLLIKLAVFVAMSDNDFADEEGKTIKEWIKKTLDTEEGKTLEKLKKQYNKAFKDSYLKAKNGTLTISKITKELNKLADKSQKYDAIELCLSVMSADGVAEKEELQAIKNISEKLGLDFDEVQKMKDQYVIKLSSNNISNDGAEDLLGIDPNWSKEKIKKHLNLEFKKWNGRLNSLEDGEERDNAQNMLDLIAEARNKYGK